MSEARSCGDQLAIWIILVLILTGTLGVVLAFTFSAIGWFIGLVLILGILGWVAESWETIRDRRWSRYVRKQRQKLGYDDSTSTKSTDTRAKIE